MNSIAQNTQVLCWHRATLQLVPARPIGYKTPAIVILNAFLKSIKPGIETQTKVKISFRVADFYAHRLKNSAGEVFTLEVDFFGADDAWINYWLAALERHVTHNPHAGFSISTPPLVSVCTFDFNQSCETAANAQLEFLSPLPFRREKGSSRTHLSPEMFFAQLVRRAGQLFDMEFIAPDITDLQLQSNCWNYTELHHASKSQPGNTQYYNGCFGSLFFTGSLNAVLPWLKLAAAIHAGGSVELNPLGYCRLHLPSRPLLDTQLNSPANWKDAWLHVLETRADGASPISAVQAEPLNADEYCRDLMRRVCNGAWQPSSTQANSDDILVHTVLHELLNEPVNRSIKAAAHGVRKEASDQDVASCVQNFLDQGYSYSAVSGIEELFQRVNIDRMEILLDEVIPPADVKIRQTLKKMLRAADVDDSPGGGGRQDSPLTRLISKLYLDSIAAICNERDAQLVRHGDDFIILARAQMLLQNVLDIVLRTPEGGQGRADGIYTIRSMEEGFHFIGQSFGGADGRVLPDMLAPLARKTIYITECGCFLGHNGDAMEIRQDGKLVDSIPLRRVADVVVLASVSLSSGLIQKCARLEIPLTMAWGRGCQVSIPHGSRKQHNIAAAQALHHARLTHAERLEIAQGFAATKIANYKPLINSRHAKGNAELLKKLDDSIADIKQAADLGSVRGHEGRAAKLMFAALNGYIKVPEFHFEKRLRENPDRMNVLFNFGYHLLFARLNTMLRAAGLNPYLGFLHDSEGDYETLVCDIEEVFRAALDRHLIALVNLRIIKAGDFMDKDNRLRLSSLATKRFVEHFERLLHGDAGGISLLQAMQAQVHAVIRCVTEGQSLWYFNCQQDVPLLRADEGDGDSAAMQQTDEE